MADDFQGSEVAQTGNAFFVKDLLDEGREVGGEEGLDVVWGHEKAGIHGFLVFGEG